MNNESLMAKRFMNDLERLYSQPDALLENTGDEEYNCLLALSRHLLQIDFRTEAFENICTERIAVESRKKAAKQKEDKRTDELSDEELDKLSAAGDSFKKWTDFNKKD